MGFQLEVHTGVLIKKAARLFERVANESLVDIGVTYAQTIILIRLLTKNGQSQAELAKSSALKQPTIVRLLDRMERDHLLERVRNPEDRRAFQFFLTTKGKKAAQKLEKHANAMHVITSKSFTKKELDKFNKMVMKVTENLQGYLGEG